MGSSQRLKAGRIVRRIRGILEWDAEFIGGPRGSAISVVEVALLKAYADGACDMRMQVCSYWDGKQDVDEVMATRLRSLREDARLAAKAARK